LYVVLVVVKNVFRVVVVFLYLAMNEEEEIVRVDDIEPKLVLSKEELENIL
jgi:hypothetical protein